MEGANDKNSFNLLRLCLALFVIVTHSYALVGGDEFNDPLSVLTNRQMKLSVTSVKAFFVISGFLIGSILFKEYQKNLSLSFKRFYLNRFFRLMPVYFVCVFLGIIFYSLIKNSNSDMAPQIELMLGNFWTNLLYVNNFIPVQEQFMGWCWSLAIEEQFYLLVPLFIVGLFKWIKQKVWFFITLFFLSFVVRFYVVYHYNLVGEGFWGEDITSDSWRNTFNLLYSNLYTRYGGLLVGVLGSYFYVCYLNQVKKFFGNVSFSRVLYFLSVFVFLCVFFKIDFIYFSELTKTGLVSVLATIPCTGKCGNEQLRRFPRKAEVN